MWGGDRHRHDQRPPRLGFGNWQVTPLLWVISLMVTPLRYKSLIMKRLSTFSISGPPCGTSAYPAMMPNEALFGQSGEFYLGPFGDFTLGRDNG